METVAATNLPSRRYSYNHRVCAGICASEKKRAFGSVPPNLATRMVKPIQPAVECDPKEEEEKEKAQPQQLTADFARDPEEEEEDDEEERE